MTDSENTLPRQMSPDVLSALQGVRFIAQHIKDADKDNEVLQLILSCTKVYVSMIQNSVRIFLIYEIIYVVILLLLVSLYPVLNPMPQSAQR